DARPWSELHESEVPGRRHTQCCLDADDVERQRQLHGDADPLPAPLPRPLCRLQGESVRTGALRLLAGEPGALSPRGRRSRESDVATSSSFSLTHTLSRWRSRRKPTATPVAPTAAGSVRVTWPVSGSMRESVPSAEFATQSAPAPKAKIGRASCRARDPMAQLPGGLQELA